MMNFGSDNQAPVRQEIIDAILSVNQAAMSSYGEDELSQALNRQYSEFFEWDVAVYPVISGTAANALSLAHLMSSSGAALCHQHAHINIHEAGAPEFFSGGKLVPLHGDDGKLSTETLAEAFQAIEVNSYHASLPNAVSITQASEYGTLYTLNEVKNIAELAHDHGAGLHMDGARFANAIASLGCSPADLSWRAGVDILSLGSSKNGTMNAEAIIDFNPATGGELKRRLKQSGQLVSKSRYIAVQLRTYIDNDNYLNWANQSNALACRMVDGLSACASIEVVYPVGANILILRMPGQLARYLQQQGAVLFPWSELDDCYRMVMSNLNSETDVDDFLALVKNRR